jgi:adenylyltransferase/sulfurtransferase
LPPLVEPAAELTREEVARYSRHLIIPDLGVDGQKRLKNARVLVIGAGGLGSPTLLYLAAAGVGTIGIVEFDVVDESNLQRQIIHGQDDIGESKASSAARALAAINPRTRVDALDYEIDDDELWEQARAADVIVDCTDNFPTRFALNRVSIGTGTPLVSGAAIRWEGQVATFIPTDPDSPCYQCLYPDESVEAATCAAEGVIAPLVGVVGSIEALEAMRVLTGLTDELAGRLLLIDGLAMEWQVIRLPRNPDCPACSAR